MWGNTYVEIAEFKLRKRVARTFDKRIFLELFMWIVDNKICVYILHHYW